MRRLKFLLFSLVPTIVLLLILEAAARLYYRYVLLDDFMPIDLSDSFHNVPDLFERRHTANGDVLFSRYFPTRYYVNDRSYRGKTMASSKTPRIFRVFSYGGSSTAGSPWGHEASASRFLEDELNALKRDGTTVEVVNFGAGGYGSTRMLGLVEATIKYQPDILVVSAGHNEYADNWVYLELAKDKLKTQIRRYGDRMYIVRVARMLLDRQRMRPPDRIDLLRSNAMYNSPLIEGNIGFKTADRRYLATQFKQNLVAIIQTARAHHVQVLLVSEPANFFFQPSWYPGKGDQVQARLLEELRAAFEIRNFELARSRANEILKLNGENPMAHFYLGLCENAAGDKQSAREHLLAAIDYDERPERYTRAYRFIEQQLQDESDGVFFIDAGKAAIDFLNDGLLDGRLLVDKMHCTIEGNKLTARTVVDDYFARHHVRPDLFEYDRLDPERIWKDNVSPDFYFMICARYFDITDCTRCVDEVYKRYTTMQESSPEKWIYRSSWEYLFYYGLRTQDASWFEKSGAIYRGHSLEAARPNWTAPP